MSFKVVLALFLSVGASYAFADTTPTAPLAAPTVDESVITEGSVAADDAKISAPAAAAPAEKASAPVKAVAKKAHKKAAKVTAAYTADYPTTVKVGEKFTFKPNVAACKTGKGCGDFKKGQEVYVNKSKKVTQLFWSCPCPNCLLTKLKFSKAGDYSIDVKLADGSYASFPVKVVDAAPVATPAGVEPASAKP